MQAHQTSKTERLPQKLLAAEVTELVHGPAALSRALTAAQVLYSTSISSLTAEKVLDAFRGDMRFHRVKKEDLAEMGVGKVTVTYGLCGSVGKYFFLIFTRKWANKRNRRKSAISSIIGFASERQEDWRPQREDCRGRPRRRPYRHRESG